MTSSKAQFRKYCSYINDRIAEDTEKQLDKINLDDDFQMLVIGEYHSFELNNIQIEQALIKYFIEKYDSVSLVEEVPFAYSYLLNNYLEFNDTTIKSLYYNLYCQDINRIEHLKNLYDNNSKFRVVGLDLAGASWIRETILALNVILLKKNLKPSWYLNINQLNYFLANIPTHKGIYTNKHQQETLFNISKKIYFDAQNAKSLKIYKQLFGEDWTSFFRIIEDYYIGYLHRNAKASSIPIRENILHLRMKKILQKNLTHKYLGRFGNAHIMKKEIHSPIFQDTSFVARLVQDSFKIISICTLYSFKSEKQKFQKWRNIIEEFEDYFFTDTSFEEELFKYYRKEDNYLIDFKSSNVNAYFDYVLFLNKPISTKK